ncbi:putative suppressor [Cyanobacterium stanieri PCC 7202]|uniref:Suppressor n=1 Tax=Cyanobacterium stanieri (strain ATCC 29140 / PCC 7202) TaxID=292563 RepID=K9YJ59_CYASC|nr:putative suppressor [Cyanobacterium stanieri PCC 7202]
MKGGISSGIVYPPAILELVDNNYYFKQIGGSSAGAIAACATAAAEYGRREGNDKSFDTFQDKTEKFLSEPKTVTNLRSLFQPTKENQPLFDLIFKLLEADNKLLFLLTNILPLTSIFTRTTFGFGNFKLNSLTENYHLTHLKKNHWGLCTGMEGVSPVRGENRKAVTQWLHDVIQKCSGLNNTKPLTFGDLEDTPPQDKITLRMVTSNLSQNQPYILPFEHHYFIFERNEFNQLFPQELVDYMVNDLVPKQTQEYQQNNNFALPIIDNHKGKEYYFLPIGKYMPVLVATRMSMSFPILFSMIPLYSIKASAKNKPIIKEEDLLINLFSDGGISSNFPIHFFDALIPSYPTFGIDLVTQQTTDQFSFIPTNIRGEYYKIPEPNVYLPKPDHLPSPMRYELDGLLNIIMKGIFPTAQNYRDTMQSGLPSYRERIVKIYLEENEGGLNLNMTSSQIENLQNKGHEAGTKLTQEFHFRHHQWVRVKIMMGLLEKGLTTIDRANFNYQLLLEQQQNNSFPYAEKDENWGIESQKRINALACLIVMFKQPEIIDQIKNMIDDLPAEISPDEQNELNKIFAITKPLEDEKQILLRVTPEI